MAQGIESTSSGGATGCLFFFVAAPRAPSRKTSARRSGLQTNWSEEMAEKLTTYDPAEDLTSDKEIADFMAEALKTNDAGYIAHAVGVIARARGMSQIASETGLSREQLYRSFSENGNPTLRTTLAVMKALGIELTAKPAA
jgi:probable addiction module antidote protein